MSKRGMEMESRSRVRDWDCVSGIAENWGNTTS